MNSNSSACGGESAAAIDSEHQIQIALARALCAAARSTADADAGQTRRILEQLVDYSEAHFMSEQLLMRLASHPEYDEHVLDHDQMMETLRRVAAFHEAGQTAVGLGEAQEMLSLLTRHIATRDRRFNEHYLEWSRQAAAGGASAHDGAA